MESANKYEVQQGTDRLANINEDKVLKVEELRAANALNIEGMKDFVKNNRKEAPKAPDANANLDTIQQYQQDLGAHNEMKTVLDRFDAQISALKTNYETSKEGLKDATKEELAKLESTLGIEQKPVAPAAAPAEQKDAKPAETPASKPEPAKAETVAAAPAEQKDAPKTAEYVVKKGDNLTKIAKEHGTTVEALAKENKLGDDKRKWGHILVGQKLKVPAKAEAKPTTDAEAAKAATKPAEAGKDGKAADGKPADAPKAEAKTEKKDGTPVSKGEAEVKAAAKADVPPPATATVAERAKVEATVKPEPTKISYADTQTPIGGSNTSMAGGPKKNGT